MNKADVLKLLEIIEEALEDKSAAISSIAGFEDIDLREKVLTMIERITDKCVNKHFIESNINSLNNQILEYAQNNYYCEVPLTECNDELDSLITSMNMLGEEINYSTVSRIYFTDIYNTIPDFILVVDDKGLIYNANTTFLNTFKLNEEDLIKRHNICDYIKDECMYIHLVAAINDGDNYRTLCIDGAEEMPVTIKMADFTESKNGKSFRVFILRDFTEMLRYQEELNQALKKAQESDRLKSAFLANMSHEIRTPMNGILGFTELLKTDNISEEKRNQFVSLIQASGNRMLNTVNDIIEISKIQAGQMTVIMSEFDIVEELNSLCDVYEKDAKKKGLDFKMKLDFNNTLIRTDKSKLQSILSNLIKNAIKFTDKGSVKLDCKRVDEKLICAVTDTGIGIRQERQEAIFESFVQADIEDIRAYQGSGLGLSITKAHIDMLGGEISLCSEENHGSCFAFSIPWQKNGRSYVRVKGFDFEDKSDPQWTILVAEDDITNYEYLRSLLERKSKQILWAKTGVESLNFVKTHPNIDFVLMDIRMPGMDGYEATKKIKKLRPELPVVAQTAYALPEDKEKALQAGCDGFLAKPLEIEKLKLILEDL